MTDRKMWTIFLNKFISNEKGYEIDANEIYISPEDTFDYESQRYKDPKGKIVGNSWASCSIHFEKDGKFKSIEVSGD